MFWQFQAILDRTRNTFSFTVEAQLQLPAVRALLDDSPGQATVSAVYDFTFQLPVAGNSLEEAFALAFSKSSLASGFDLPEALRAGSYLAGGPKTALNLQPRSSAETKDGTERRRFARVGTVMFLHLLRYKTVPAPKPKQAEGIGKAAPQVVLEGNKHQF